MTDGATLIAVERKRQIEEEGWTAEHDHDHTDGSLAMVACLFAAPIRIYKIAKTADGFFVVDPWPKSWHQMYDRRFATEVSKQTGSNGPPDPKNYTTTERLDLLVKAGALLAAEIDRLQRRQ